jgi:2',3'-cyclic-nucleotide 2'-phosphodiesterase
MAAPVTLLFIGDLVGEPAVAFTCAVLPKLFEQYAVDFCVVNAENAHQGRGLNDVIVRKLFDAGVDVITGGDHSFDKHLVFPLMDREPRLLRPYNYPEGVPGFGFGIYELPARQLKLAVINLRGQAFFQNPISDPFRAADTVLAEVLPQTPIVFVDFHAEATAEKAGLALYLDGRISALVGTHTHVPTADERVLPGGTGFLSDAGATCPRHSVIGMDIDVALQRFLLQMPQKYELAKGLHRLHGALVSIDPETGHCLSMTRIAVDEEA